MSKFLTKIVYYLYLALCKKACLNGGFCYDSNKCNCKSGWSGNTCNIGKIISTLHDLRSQSNVCACASFVWATKCRNEPTIFFALSPTLGKTRKTFFRYKKYTQKFLHFYFQVFS